MKLIVNKISVLWTIKFCNSSFLHQVLFNKVVIFYVAYFVIYYSLTSCTEFIFINIQILFIDTDEPTPQLVIWITSEPSKRLPTNLLDSVISISWHYITDDFFSAGESKTTSSPLAGLTDSLNRGW